MILAKTLDMPLNKAVKNMRLHNEIVAIRSRVSHVHSKSSSGPFETSSLGSPFKMFPKKEFLAYKQNTKRPHTCPLTTTLTCSITNVGLFANEEAMICITTFHIQGVYK